MSDRLRCARFVQKRARPSSPRWRLTARGSRHGLRYIDVFRELYNPKLNPRWNGKQFASGTLHRSAGGTALFTTGAGVAGTCTDDCLRAPFIRGFIGDGYSGSGRPNLQCVAAHPRPPAAQPTSHR